VRAAILATTRGHIPPTFCDAASIDRKLNFSAAAATAAFEGHASRLDIPQSAPRRLQWAVDGRSIHQAGSSVRRQDDIHALYRRRIYHSVSRCFNM